MDSRRRHRLHLSAFATALVASLAIATPSAHAAECAGANQLPVLASVASAKSATLCLLNAQRVGHGLGPLTSEPMLEGVATSYATSMVAQRFFAHVTPAGQTLDQRLASYLASEGALVGENLAWGHGALGTPNVIVDGWMRSQSHRDTVLDETFHEIGIGIAMGSPVGGLPGIGATYATEFGSRPTRSAAPPAQASAASDEVAAPVAAQRASTKLGTLSAKAKRSISKQCHRVVDRSKGSRRTRRARYDRCVRARTRAARASAGAGAGT